jgi:hypothetical protein
MAETTAVKFRRGSKSDHEAWKGGLQGEITSQVGSKSENTIWIHEGDGDVGTPMARADLNNVDMQSITSKGIARNDLANIQLGQTADTVRAQFEVLGYAQKDGTNLNTTPLTEARSDELGPVLAKADLTNVNTASLATDSGHTGKNLAYADLSNVTKNSIATKLANDTFIKVNGSNANTDVFATDSGHTGKNLAYADLSNLDIAQTKETVYNNGIQLVDNLVNDLNAPVAGTYPSAQAVKTAIENAVSSVTLPVYPETDYGTKLFLEATYQGSLNTQLNWSETIDSELVAFNNIDETTQEEIIPATNGEEITDVYAALYSLGTSVKDLQNSLGTISAQLDEILS